MDYDDIDYDEGYSMIDIDNNWSNSNMKYDETDSDSDSDIDNYNYNDNSSINIWSILIGDKINQQINKHNDSFLDIINKKLKSLEATERSIIVERKNDSSVESKNDNFLDLYERLKALNSPLKKESKFEPYLRSSFTKTVTDGCYISNNKKEVIHRRLDIKDEIEKVNNSNDSLKEMMEKHNNNKEVSSSVQIICKKIEIDLQKEKDFFLKQDIERQKSLIETKEEVGKVKDMQNQKKIVLLKNLYVGNLKQRMR